jgi:beta-glucanase (GH16 family)
VFEINNSLAIMRNSYLLFSALIILLSQVFVGCEKPESIAGCSFPDSLDAYTLVWSDEFSGTELDTSKWSYQIGDGCEVNLCGGWGNNELQYYTSRPENISLANDRLIITAKKETPLYQGRAYTSARIRSLNKGDFRYGRIDVSARMPKGQGIWPAIWMLPSDTVFGEWPKSGEIDIAELVGHEPNILHGTLHYGPLYPQNRSKGYQDTLSSGNFSDGFHVFSVQWQEDCIRFLLDDEPYGKPISRTTLLPYGFPFTERFHLLLNVAVGGNWPGNPNASTLFPQKMYVDYVKVYQEN